METLPTHADIVAYRRRESREYVLRHWVEAFKQLADRSAWEPVTGTQQFSRTITWLVPGMRDDEVAWWLAAIANERTTGGYSTKVLGGSEHRFVVTLDVPPRED